ncbi:MAG TPA: glycosyl hydrolase family 8, partial [Telluria sp.]|nr:glycosyl hydrolase family 8 [Telluria sp.]
MKRRHFLLSGTASAALALTGCGGGGSESTATSASDSNAAAAAGTTGRRMQVAAAAGGVTYPFGSRPSTYVAGIKPSAANASADAALAAQYDAWKAARVVPVSWIAPGGYAIQFSDPSFLTVSEGMGYGMLIAVLFAGHDPNAQQLFDGLLAVARAKYAYAVAQYEPMGKYLMDWQLWANGTSNGGGWSACDGDLDIAMALLMADRQWGSGGTWNYKQEALNTIAALKAWNFDAATGAVGGRGVQYAGSARISDFMIGHFRAFRAATGDSFWDLAIAKNLAVMDYLQNNYSGGVGLLPDWAINANTTWPSPSPGYIGDHTAYEMDYWWNACRVPWRLGTDYVLSGDQTVKTICGRITQFFQNQVNAAGGDVMAIGTGYSLWGG